MTKNQTGSLHAARMGNIPALLMPLLLFAGLVVVLAIGLTLNPREVPSPLIGKRVLDFDLPPVKGRTLGLAGSDLKGEVSLVNVFASWCVACKEEHPVFLQLQREGFVPIHGLNYKDRPEDAARWLDTLGDPYTRTGADLDGRIAYKHIGAVTPDVLEKKLRPLIAGLRVGGAAADSRRGGPR